MFNVCNDVIAIFEQECTSRLSSIPHMHRASYITIAATSEGE